MTLIQFLKGNENARKVFGKQELLIIEKQLLGVSLTQSEKNRLSRDVRAKFEFIKNASRYEDEFGVRKGSGVEREIERAKEVILKHTLAKKIKRIVLYGSSVTGERMLRSDVDIAVVFEKIGKKKATLFRRDVLGEFSLKMDIQVYNVLPDKLKKEIDKNGKVIWKR